MRPTALAVGAAGVTVAVVASCSKPAAPAAAPDVELVARGWAVYETEACAACHGAGRRGGDVAPSLSNLGDHWEEDRLVAFLTDPVAYRAHDPRMREVAARYPAEMPGVPTGDVERIRALAHYLLHE